MKILSQAYWREFASGNRTGIGDSLLLLLLTPIAWLYSSALRLRATLYNIGILKTYCLPRTVISIGNIAVGGTGKTPVTAYIARVLLSQGLRVAVLTRGYGGSLEGQTVVVSDGTTTMLSARECGDEPFLLATTVPGVMVVIGTDRYAAGQMAMQQLAPDIFLLDDGFQHQRLHRDLNILLLDFFRPFGNNLTLPAGILREPPDAARRAGLIIFTRAPVGAALDIERKGVPACIAHHDISDLIPLRGGQPLPCSSYGDSKVLAFTGIADPESFFEGLRIKGLNTVCCLSFPDHVVYSRERCDEIEEAMRSSEADLLVTTEKDGVKLTELTGELAARTLLARLELTIDNPELLKGLLTDLLKRHKA